MEIFITIRDRGLESCENLSYQTWLSLKPMVRDAAITAIIDRLAGDICKQADIRAEARQKAKGTIRGN